MNRSNFSIPLVNGTFDQDLPGFEPGYHQLVFSYTVKPSAGKLAVFTKTGTDDDWLPLAEAQNVDLTANKIVIAFGAIRSYRFVLSGIVGGSGMVAWVASGIEWPGPGLPDGLFSGLRAITVQPYTEANVKNGVQYYVRAVWPTSDAIVTGEPGSRLIWFKTGAKQVVVKLRDMLYVAEELRLRLFRAPTGVAGGTDLVIHNYNGVNPVATTCLAKKNVTVATLGAEFDGGDPEFFFGEATSGNRTPTSIPQGRERILPPNTEFIVQLTNLSTGGGSAARVQYYLDWYEGGTDLPL